MPAAGVGAFAAGRAPTRTKPSSTRPSQREWYAAINAAFNPNPNPNPSQREWYAAINAAFNSNPNPNPNPNPERVVRCLQL